MVPPLTNAANTLKPCTHPEQPKEISKVMQLIGRPNRFWSMQLVAGKI